MPLEKNKALVRRYYEDVVGTGNLEAVGNFLSPNYVAVHENVRSPIGVEGAKEHVRGIRRTYPDLRLTVDQQIAEGEWVASKVTARGTHRGEWLGIKPTGKLVEITAVNIDRVLDNRIVEHCGAANTFESLLRIGAIQLVRE